MYRRILIVGSTPYNKNTPARAFDAYFHGWEPENLAQIFSNPATPKKGHAGYFYQLTDKRMLQRFLGKKVRTERIWTEGELETDNGQKPTPPSDNGGIYKKLYGLGAKKTPLVYLLRRMIWKKKNWCNDTLNAWLDEFKPECVFLAFSDDFFIPAIALYAAERFDIPIVSCIGDDYYFNYRRSLNPLYHIYKRSYRKLIRKVFAHGGSAIYISNKIRDKYNSEFGLTGETVYLTSEIERREYRPIRKEQPLITYFGNIRQGRNESLNAIGQALGEISPDYKLEVYSGQTERKTVKVFDGNPSLDFKGRIPYSEVVKKTAESDVVVIVEGFKKKHVNNTRYSLSTKAADSLASGAQILVYGSGECGVIEYMQSTEAAAVCTDRAELTACIRGLLEDEARQRSNYVKAVEVSQRNHTLESSTGVFRSVVEDAIHAYRNKDTH